MNKDDLEEKDTNGKFPKGKKNLSLWIFIFLGMLLVANYFQKGNLNENTQAVPYSQMLQTVKSGQVQKVTFKGNKVFAETKAAESGGKAKTLITTLPDLTSSDLLKVMEEKNVEIVAKEDDSGTWTNVLIGLLPWLLIFGFFFYSSRNLNKRLGSMNRPPFMGQDKNHEVDVAKSHVTFDQVAGSDGAKRDLQEVVDFLKEPDKFLEMGAQLPRGVLMVGPPGTGKTLMAKAVAGEAGVPFFSMSGSEFIELYVGMGASRVRKLFESAKEKSPAIIFIDEIDSIGRSRGTGLGGGHDEREQTLNQILAEMDGFSSDENVVVLAATNRPDVLDSALTRPGRFDRQIVMDLPMVKTREKILKIHAKKTPLDDDVNLEEVAQSTPGFSGAELKNLVNEAALLAAREGLKKINAESFSLARDKVLMGNPREEHLTDKQKRVIAVHESGHALVAILSPESNPITKITIIPRGRALGFTEQTPKEDMVNQSRQYLLTQLAILLGGRVAEEQVIGEITTGAQDDLKRATKLARQMVAKFGMSDTFGPLSFEVEEEHAFLGREMAKSRNFSEKTAQKIDDEIQKLLTERKEYTSKILKENRDKLDKLSQILFEKETLTKLEIKELLDLKDD